MSKESALVITHPHEEFDDGVIEDEVYQTVANTSMDTYVVESSNVESDPYAVSEFDQVLEEESYGQLKMEDAELLKDNYDNILQGGGYIDMCAENTYESLLEAGFETENIEIVPELTYDQSFSGKKYSVADVLETRNAEAISKYIESSNNDLIDRARFNDRFIEEVKDDIHRASEMTVREAHENPVSINLGFDATLGVSRTRIEG